MEARITEYLANGGLFNPEAMDHAKVRDLLIDCRDDISRLVALLDERTKELDAALARVGRLEAENSELRRERDAWFQASKDALETGSLAPAPTLGGSHG